MEEFLSIDKTNIHLYCDFAVKYRDDLKNYQSRIYPENSDFFVVLIEKGLLKWDYIVHEGEIIGAIWLEKEHASMPVAKLGVFIRCNEKRSKGIGRQAIDRYIKIHTEDFGLCRVTLNVRKENIRRVKCYKKCGFEIEKEFVKDGIKVYDMRKEIQ